MRRLTHAELRGGVSHGSTGGKGSVVEKMTFEINFVKMEKDAFAGQRNEEEEVVVVEGGTNHETSRIDELTQVHGIE